MTVGWLCALPRLTPVPASWWLRRNVQQAREGAQKRMEKLGQEYYETVQKYNAAQKVWVDHMVNACTEFEAAERERMAFMAKTMSRYAQHMRDVHKCGDDALQMCQQQYARHDPTADIRSFIKNKGTGTVSPRSVSGPLSVPGSAVPPVRSLTSLTPAVPPSRRWHLRLHSTSRFRCTCPPSSRLCSGSSSSSINGSSAGRARQRNEPGRALLPTVYGTIRPVAAAVSTLCLLHRPGAMVVSSRVSSG